MVLLTMSRARTDMFILSPSFQACSNTKKLSEMFSILIHWFSRLFLLAMDKQGEAVVIWPVGGTVKEVMTSDDGANEVMTLVDGTVNDVMISERLRLVFVSVAVSLDNSLTGTVEFSFATEVSSLVKFSVENVAVLLFSFKFIVVLKLSVESISVVVSVLMLFSTLVPMSGDVYDI